METKRLKLPSVKPAGIKVMPETNEVKRVKLPMMKKKNNSEYREAITNRSSSDTVNNNTKPKLSFTKTKHDKHRDTNVLYGSGVTKKEVAKAKKTNVATATVQHPEQEIIPPEKPLPIPIDKLTPDKHTKSVAEQEVIPPYEYEVKHPQMLTRAQEGELIKLASPRDKDEITLDASQQRAVDGVMSQRYSCLIGQAGTGKTTCLKFIIRRLEQTLRTIDLNETVRSSHRNEEPRPGLSIAFCAFTGKATNQMMKALPKAYHSQCNTIHTTLGYAPEIEPRQDKKTGEWKEVKVWKPTFDEDYKLPYDVVVVDETSMLAIPLWEELLAALRHHTKDNCKIIFVGDINQLPPVQGRSVFGFAMLKWPVYALTELHRNAGVIARNADRILKGETPKVDPEKFVMVQIEDGSIKAGNDVMAATIRLNKLGVFDPLTDALIVPQNKGDLGQVKLNQKLVNFFNAEKRSDDGTILNPRISISTGLANVHYAVGDKIMFLENDKGRKLTNGMIGVVTHIGVNGSYKGNHHVKTAQAHMNAANADMSDLSDIIKSKRQQRTVETTEDEDDIRKRQASHIVTVHFDYAGEQAFSTAGEFRAMTHAYAMTCHKSQGSEYKTVIVVVHASNSQMLCREWFYTAVTRASERVVILYNVSGMLNCLHVQRITGDTIEEKARHFIELGKDENTRVPNLPEPEEMEYA